MILGDKVQVIGIVTEIIQTEKGLYYKIDFGKFPDKEWRCFSSIMFEEKECKLVIGEPL